MLTFVLSDVVAEKAARVFTVHRDRIRARLPDVEIRHTGGTSVPGVLTSGDVDLQVRTDKHSFDVARDALSELYEPFHLDAWHSEGAFYFAPGSQPAVEVALTAIGGLDDLHHGDAWLQIAADPRLIEQYNALKRAHEGGSMNGYNAAKRAFFYENFQL
jgi:GrpB-like predicted nucleotidyltransferase (UPF0157 family)